MKWRASISRRSMTESRQPAGEREIQGEEIALADIRCIRQKAERILE
jgi:hypothetical protein